MKYYILLASFLLIFILNKASTMIQLPLELQEHILVHTLPLTLDVVSFKMLSDVLSTNVTFYELFNHQQGYVKKKIASIFSIMWQKNDYTTLVDILTKIPSQSIFYKVLCETLQHYTINVQFVDETMKLFERRSKNNIYITLKEKFSNPVVHEIILITCAHLCIMPNWTLIDNQNNDMCIESFIKNLATLQPNSLDLLFNKMIVLLIGYITKRNSQKKYDNLQSWITSFARSLVY